VFIPILVGIVRRLYSASYQCIVHFVWRLHLREVHVFPSRKQDQMASDISVLLSDGGESSAAADTERSMDLPGDEHAYTSLLGPACRIHPILIKI